jgi:hypothetical protein
LEYKRTRTGTSAIHKELKSHSLKVGKFLDAWKNTQAMTADGAEEKLVAIENYETLEKQRKIDVLQEKRTKALKKYDLEVVPDNLGELDTVSWTNYLTGTKVNFDKKKEAEKKEEESRIETERITGLRAVRRAETVKYSDFIPDHYKSLDLGEIKDEVYHEILQQAKDKFDAKVKQDELDKKELERLQRESEKKEKELKEEREKRETAEKILSDQKVDEARKLQEELDADDATKVESLVKNLEYLTTKYTFKSAKNVAMYVDVQALLGKVINHIKK